MGRAEGFIQEAHDVLDATGNTLTWQISCSNGFQTSVQPIHILQYLWILV